MASGYPRARLRWLLLGEGSALAVGGAVVGDRGRGALCLASFRNCSDRLGLGRWTDRSFGCTRGKPEGSPTLSVMLAGVLASVLTIFWAVRILGRAQPSALLAGQPPGETDSLQVGRSRRWSPWVSGSAGVIAIGLLVCGPFIHDHEMQAMAFFGGGASCSLVPWQDCGAGCAGDRGPAPSMCARSDDARRSQRVSLSSAKSTYGRAARCSRFRRDCGGIVPPRAGCRSLWRKIRAAAGSRWSASRTCPFTRTSIRRESGRSLASAGTSDKDDENVQIVECRQRSGDDVSCLNLYQARRPRLVGVPAAFVERGGFRFQDSEAMSPEQKANPWTLLASSVPDAVPAIADATTVEWTLKSKLGGIVEVPNEHGDSVRLRIVGLLSESVFQSELLVSEASFLKMYPHHEGFNFFLVAAPAGEISKVKASLEASLAEQGFEATTTASRLASYLAVENTYLSTFQALGGFGLLLGALGMAVVLLRGVWERRGELALLRALGFRHRALAWLVLSENGFLLMLGVGAGTMAALLAVAPHWLAAPGKYPGFGC